eukprot:CAMPEP_0115845420 /NCGR_PEP_ID=MMETSP0287-20121206/9343_1 /TAXON_ID=412157 /ORGANISM="Chrysochromulina rotalis, Strain UIO044" /LENGTH=105 /DNA_ID=CAMNT_0003299193 /DNA_START=487 /DNA_END=804 /DNA_ORIENTATION=+
MTMCRIPLDVEGDLVHEPWHATEVNNVYAEGADGGGEAGGGVIPTKAFTAAISCRRVATSPIKSATVVEVPAMRRSAASNSPEQTSLSSEALRVKVSESEASSGP